MVTSFEKALAKPPRDKFGYHFLHASFFQRPSSSGKVIKKKKKHQRKIQVLLPSSVFGEPTLHTDVPVLCSIWNSLPVQATNGERQRVDRTYRNELNDKWEKKARKILNLVSFCLPQFACTSDRATVLSVLLELIKSAQLQWNTLRLRKITLWTHLYTSTGTINLNFKLNTI